MMIKLAKNREKRNGRVKNIDERDAERIKKTGAVSKRSATNNCTSVRRNQSPIVGKVGFPQIKRTTIG